MIPRLYCDQPLADGAIAALTAEQAHYLRGVLRRKEGDGILLFNPRDGEFAATLTEVSKKGAAAALGRQTRMREAEPDIHLLFAPVKRAAIEMIVQKGTELGASAFLPVITDRTNADRLRADRLTIIATEAAEQCGRLSVPPVGPTSTLADALLHWDKARVLYYCDEAGDDPSREWGGAEGRAAPKLEVVGAVGAGPAAILIGPEGGFTPAERQWLRALPFVHPVSLGPLILRADTAAIAALTLWRAAARS